ncbi:hypothetical protein KFL_007300060 [Klebsormidium nitens]|uniref:Apple domain-containing protein n=1 Tax=Klebsormidium nitens TaxID=105231 RepID=A0A1Y1IJV8_KLENI|nr:hypothetical protein KFL_007300060 [Klebsormidium nitens]|eukprot:GAQ91120.1 hypothetical protein KFL_007300060 [Klebsormidium nitens]
MNNLYYPGPTAPTLPYTYIVQPNADYYLNDIRPSDGPMDAPTCGYLTYSNTDAPACETRCDAAAGCAGFVHVADVNCCFLKGRMDSPTANTRTIAHLKTGLPGYVVAYGKDNPGNDIFPSAGAPTNAALCGDVATVESIGACIARCDNEAACVGIAHCADHDCCYLKSTLGPENANTRVAMLRKTALATPPPTTRPPTPPPTTAPARKTGGGGGGAGLKNWKDGDNRWTQSAEPPPGVRERLSEVRGICVADFTAEMLRGLYGASGALSQLREIRLSGRRVTAPVKNTWDKEGAGIATGGKEYQIGIESRGCVQCGASVAAQCRLQLAAGTAYVERYTSQAWQNFGSSPRFL